MWVSQGTGDGCLNRSEVWVSQGTGDGCLNRSEAAGTAACMHGCCGGALGLRTVAGVRWNN
eukprot:350422-Chlamydomonas_euryale.AAC.7